MFTFASSRFTDATWAENESYRARSDKLFRHHICCERDVKQEIINAFLNKFHMKKIEEYKELST
jgi:hypothetical protein